ncbi:MAG: T9SS type A sorting domain-containing protein [Flavobacteriales bacterium]
MKRTTLLFLLSLATSAFAQSPSLQKVVAPDRFSDAFFGYTTAISGDVAIIGAEGNLTDEENTANLEESGAVYVYEKINKSWFFQQKLVPSDRKKYDLFGHSLDVKNDMIVVGAIQEVEDVNGNKLRTSTGAAYIFKKVNGRWTEVKKLLSGDARPGDCFGSAVKIHDNSIFVSSWLSDLNEQGEEPLADAGAIYIFKNEGTDWIQAQKLVNSDRRKSDYFGHNIYVNGDYLAVGMPLYRTDQNNLTQFFGAGVVYLFKNENGTWKQNKKILHPKLEAATQFGSSVVIDGDRLFIAAKYENADKNCAAVGANAGAVHYYKNFKGAWYLVQTIIAPDWAPNDYFGYSMCVKEDCLYIGSAHSTEIPSVDGYDGDHTGVIYRFKEQYGYWDFSSSRSNPDRNLHSFFATSLCISGDDLLIGTSLNNSDENGSYYKAKAGAAFFTSLSSFTSSEEKPGKNKTLMAFPNPTSGRVAVIFPEEKQVEWQVKVYNAIGVLVAQEQENLGRMVLDLTALEAGVYIIEANDGQNTYTSKVVKE